MTISMPPLSARLAALASAIEPGSRVADIGTDHGRLPLWLAAHGRVSFCLATERTSELLSRVGRPPAGAAWGGRLAYRPGDGLTALTASDRIDTAVIAGIGGRSIVRMLSRMDPRGSTVRRLVLQPRSEAGLVRRFLEDAGLRLDAESLTEDGGRFYPTLSASRGDGDGLYADPRLYRDDLMEAGPLLYRSGDPVVLRYWKLQRDRLAAIAGKRPASEAASALSRADRIVSAICRRAG